MTGVISSEDVVAVPTDCARVLLVTEGPVDNTHGTGVQLTRIFQKYRRGHLLVAMPEGLGAGSFDRVCVTKRFQKNLVGNIGLRVWNKLAPAFIPSAVRRTPEFDSSYLEPLVNRFNPDLVLGVVHTNDGLRLMNAVLQASRGRPSVLWFYDLQLVADRKGGFRDLNRVLSNISEIWTFSPLMLEWLHGVVKHWPAHLTTRISPYWLVPISDEYRRVHNAFSRTFRCVMLGNVWDLEMISVTKRLWRECQQKMPGLGAVQWLCHESGVRRVLSRGIELGPEIEWQGEVAENRLHDTLLNADMAIVPFSVRGDNDYRLFSVPSKIGEFAALGIPMVILAGSQTATARYVSEFGVGELLTEVEHNSWCARVCDLIQSTSERSRLSAFARQYAVRYLDQSKVRRELFEKLRRAAFGGGMKSTDHRGC